MIPEASNTDCNLVLQRQSDALKLEMLRLSFDSHRGEGRPTAESVADKPGIPGTVRERLTDNRCLIGCHAAQQPM